MFPAKDNVPVERFPFVTLGLMLANVVVFVAAGTAHPGAFTAGTLFSSLFIHTSVLQLIANLWFLWLFGSTVEDAMGPARFLGFYVAGGLVATGVAAAVHPGLPAPPAGAGGAVAAVIGGYLVLYRGARIIALSLIPFFSGAVEIPPLVLLGVWIALQVAFASAGFIAAGAAGYVSWVGGLLFGLVAVRPLATHRRIPPPTAAACR